MVGLFPWLALPMEGKSSKRVHWTKNKMDAKYCQYQSNRQTNRLTEVANDGGSLKPNLTEQRELRKLVRFSVCKAIELHLHSVRGQSSAL